MGDRIHAAARGDKLAQKEEESKELVAQVEALEIIVTAMLRNMAQNEQEMLIRQV
ncbi:hypothetical protein MJN51_32490, partial [Salmonella enterica subsp. enterica serovar Kentucky]|nr:hypothetical protein [Salmonella enterica subsp. enterica serovar Kentucky]